MVSHRKVAGFELTLGTSGELRFKKKPSEFSKYIAETLKGESGTKEEIREKFKEAAKKYKEFKEQEYPMQYLESLDQKIHKLDSIISEWKANEKILEPKEMLEIAPMTLKKIKYIIC
jgi:hypothetical protein